MVKKKFTGPVWCMIILGVLSAGRNMLIFHSVHFEIRTLKEFGFSLLFFLWPAISFIEAIVYWRIRKRNLCRQDSWYHVLLFALAIYLLPIIRFVLITFLRRNISRRYFLEIGNIVNWGQLFLTWVFIIIAHIFFVRVLRKYFSKDAPVKELVPGPVNILDEVES